jgi:integrase
MHYKDVGAFVAKLREREAITSLALEFLILTAARTGEVLGAEWPEFDLEGKVWTVLGEAHEVKPRASRAALAPWR